MSTIRVEFSEDSLFGGWENMEFYNAPACAKVYGDQLQAALENDFPGVEVEVSNTDNDRVRLDENDHATLEAVNDVIGDVYQKYYWVRYTREGVADALDIGFWYEDRFNYIFNAHEVETDDGIQYAITTHKGEMPAHNSLTYRTKAGILDAMVAIAPFEDWNVFGL